MQVDLRVYVVNFVETKALGGSKIMGAAKLHTVCVLRPVSRILQLSDHQTDKCNPCGVCGLFKPLNEVLAK
mgnify:CR=1 FL=1